MIATGGSESTEATIALINAFDPDDDTEVEVKVTSDAYVLLGPKGQAINTYVRHESSTYTCAVTWPRLTQVHDQRWWMVRHAPA